MCRTEGGGAGRGTAGRLGAGEETAGKVLRAGAAVMTGRAGQWEGNGTVDEAGSGRRARSMDCKWGGGGPLKGKTGAGGAWKAGKGGPEMNGEAWNSGDSRRSGKGRSRDRRGIQACCRMAGMDDWDGWEGRRGWRRQTDIEMSSGTKELEGATGNGTSLPRGIQGTISRRHRSSSSSQPYGTGRLAEAVARLQSLGQRLMRHGRRLAR